MATVRSIYISSPCHRFQGQAQADQCHCRVPEPQLNCDPVSTRVRSTADVPAAAQAAQSGAHAAQQSSPKSTRLNPWLGPADAQQAGLLCWHHPAAVRKPPPWLCPWLQGVANRDLKLENLLLDRDCRDGTRPLLKICDFGYSKVSIGPSTGWEQLGLVISGGNMAPGRASC